MQPLILGVGYKKGNGKNTLAKFLSTHLKTTTKLKVQEVSFAAKVKDIAFQLYGWAGIKRGIYYETHYTEKEIVNDILGKSPRQIWIELGNKMREIYQDTWISYALNGIKADVIIITDLGFKNEAKSIRAKGGTLIKITRPGQLLGTDPREIELDSWTDWDHIIDNNGSLDNLYEMTIQLWRLINET